MKSEDEGINIEIARALIAARDARLEAKDMYQEAISAARAEGWTNTEIAYVLGVSEAAIRMYRNRKGLA